MPPLLFSSHAIKLQSVFPVYPGSSLVIPLLSPRLLRYESIERCRKPRGERCWEEIQDEEERLHALVEEDSVEDDNGDDSHPGIQPA